MTKIIQPKLKFYCQSILYVANNNYFAAPNKKIIKKQI